MGIQISDDVKQKEPDEGLAKSKAISLFQEMLEDHLRTLS